MATSIARLFFMMLVFTATGFKHCQGSGMHIKNKFFCSFTAIAACFFSVTDSLAANAWFVRAHDSNHVCNPVNCDGSSYDNAWKGRQAIQWGGVSGVSPGDTLYIAGPVYSLGRFEPASGQAGAPVTISGMAPRVANPSGPADYDYGTLIGSHAGYTYNQGTWQSIFTDPVTGEKIYKIVTSGNNNTTHTKILEVDRSQPQFTHKILKAVTFTGTTPDLPYENWSAGTVGISNESPQNKVVIYKPSYPLNDPNHDLAIYTQISEAFLIQDKSHIHIEDLRVIGLGQRAILLSNADHIEIERCDISGGTDSASVTIYQDSDFGVLRDNLIHDASAGIWLYPAVAAQPNSNSNDDWLIKGNEIRDINQSGSEYAIVDPHGIGIQSGNRLRIEGNHIHHILRSGITFYNFSDSTGDVTNGNEQKDNLVAYNIIHDIYDERLSCNNYTDSNCENQRALELGSDATPVVYGTATGNMAHHNVFYNIGKTALRFKTTPQPGGPGWKFFNNVVHNADVGLAFGSGFEFKNNIISHSGARHIQLSARLENPNVQLTDVDLSHNVYFPEDGDDFAYEIDGGCNPSPCLRTGNLAWWQGATGLDGTGSTINDPLFADIAAYDFHLQPGSSAIDGGIAVGAGNDLDGNPVLGIPDQGVYEFGHKDSDNDGMLDYDELCHDGDCQNYNPYDPLVNPTGGDLDISNPDTDGDGYRDGTESALGSDPLNAGSIPVIVADGDVNLDSQVNAADVLLAQRQILGLTSLSAEQIAHGDYRPVPNGDGQLNIADLLLIVKQALVSP